jgi:hypothetical protein
MIPAEMDRPAPAHILEELCRIEYLDSLVISLNKASAGGPSPRLLWFNDMGCGTACASRWSWSRASLS